jgi:catechol 2,3-dioxygenase
MVVMSTTPNPAASTAATADGLLPDALRLGPVHLTVSDLGRSIAFYERSLGLDVQGGEGGTAALGAGGEDLVILVESPDARPAERSAGLYHFALLFPDRPALGRAVARLATTRTMIDGASDHGVSEAIYLSDTDGNGIELYADRPRDRWPTPEQGERVAMFTKPLDISDVLAAAGGADGSAPADPGLRMGHMHLHVGDLTAAVAFYRALGLETMLEWRGAAAFMSVAGYHHHLGLNTWRGVGVPPAPAGAIGLRHWTLRLPSGADVSAAAGRVRAAGAPVEERDDGTLVRDPSGNAVLLTPGG